MSKLRNFDWRLEPADLIGIYADAIELLEKINRVATEVDFKVLAKDRYLKISDCY